MQSRILPVLRQPSQTNKLARQSGWLVRKARVLSPAVFVGALPSCVSSGYCSFREIAIGIGLLTGKTISKQALSERFNASGVKFLKEIVAASPREVVRSLPAHRLDNLRGIGRIPIGDSSTPLLHPSPADRFPGATGGRNLRAAQLKFQLTFELLSGKWLETRPGPYNIPDQAAAPEILGTVARAGDLIIRDLGYASLDVFSAMGQMGAFFLGRPAHGIVLMRPDGGRPDLRDLARDLAGLPGDTSPADVLPGSAKRPACRPVIIRVPKKVADERRRRIRATAKRKGRKMPAKGYLARQDWTSLITNLGEEQADNLQPQELYRLRWRVENIFKISKSQTRPSEIARHRTNPHHLEMLLWAWMLMMISVGLLGIFRLPGPGAPGADPEIITASISKGIGRIHQWIGPSIELAAAGDFATLMDRFRMQHDHHDR